MKERTGLVTRGGKPLTLLGDELKFGAMVPDFTALDNNLQETRLSDYKGKVVIITALPSLDTSVCDLETRKFNEQAASLGPDALILAVSMDLPFAQKRWCAANDIEQVKTLSDHRDADFAKKFGVLIKEHRLLARAVFVIDREGLLRYHQLVPELGREPDYDAALAAAKELIASGAGKPDRGAERAA